MTVEPVVGLVGAYGGVGRVVARQLLDWGVTGLRVGGHRPDRLRAFVDEDLEGRAEPIAVEVDDAQSLDRFCSGCRVVVNCAGPSSRILDRVARAALTNGSDYVDPAGDDPVWDRLAPVASETPQRRIVLSAGMLPGLSGLLPRFLARSGFDEVRAMTAYLGGRDRFTQNAAVDYLASLRNGFGRSLAVWRRGQRLARGATPVKGVQPCFYPEPVSAHPYLSTETERLARQLGLREACVYNVFTGDRVLAALGRVEATGGPAAEECAAAELVRAADLDAFGRPSYQIMVFHLEGEQAGRSLTRTLLLRGPDANRLTGATVALATVQVLSQAMPPGLHFAAQGLDPAASVELLERSCAVTALETFASEGRLDADVLEEGVL